MLKKAQSLTHIKQEFITYLLFTLMKYNSYNFEEFQFIATFAAITNIK